MLILVENDSHCDFTKLREMLIRTNMEDLRDTTHSKHYEVYRKDRLQQVNLMLSNVNSDPNLCHKSSKDVDTLLLMESNLIT